MDAHSTDITFGAWKDPELDEDEKAAQQHLSDLRVAFFANKRPPAVVANLNPSDV